MSRILLLEEALSLINGLFLTFKRQDFELEIARTIGKVGEQGKNERNKVRYGLP